MSIESTDRTKTTHSLGKEAEMQQHNPHHLLIIKNKRKMVNSNQNG